MSFKPIDPKRDEFRRYLERNGVIESLTKVFIRLVKEKPENPLEYLRNNLGDTLQEKDNVSYLQNELKEAKLEIKRLHDVINDMNPETVDVNEPKAPQEVSSITNGSSSETENSVDKTNSQQQQQQPTVDNQTNDSEQPSNEQPQNVTESDQPSKTNNNSA